MTNIMCEYCGEPVEDADNYDHVLGYLCDNCSRIKFELEDTNEQS